MKPHTPRASGNSSLKENKKNSSYMDSVKHNRRAKTPVKSLKFFSSNNSIKQVNPFLKRIDRHYGCFKTKILGNYAKKFNALPFPELKPWGRAGTGCKRKKWVTKNFTALFYANGTVEIKPQRKTGLNPFDLQRDFFLKANYCLSLLERRGIACGGLDLNRRPKYGTENKAARLVRGEFRGKHRGIDGSPGHQHIDDYSAQACRRNLRLSDNQSVALAKGVVENPELFSGLHEKIDLVVSSNVEFARNIRLHLEVLNEQKVALRAIAVALRPARAPRLPSRKNSTTLRGVC